MERIQYLAPLFEGNHFAGFLRENSDIRISDRDWNNYTDNIRKKSFGPMHEKIRELGLNDVCARCSETRPILYISDVKEVGCFLQSLPGPSSNSSEPYIRKMKEINEFAFKKLSEIATSGQVDVCFKLIQVGVLPASSYWTLRDGFEILEDKFN